MYELPFYINNVLLFIFTDSTPKYETSLDSKSVMHSVQTPKRRKIDHKNVSANAPPLVEENFTAESGKHGSICGITDGFDETVRTNAFFLHSFDFSTLQLLLISMYLVHYGQLN